MKIYTKTGDSGKTSLVGGQRVTKAHPRLETYGSLDELNACIGLALAQIATSDKNNNEWRPLSAVQHQLFNLGSQLACEDETLREQLPPINENLVLDLEKQMDIMTADLPELKQFILPGGTSLAAHLHLARTVCRRCERILIHFYIEEKKDLESLEVRFLNRLSDYLFVLARYANHVSGEKDVPWMKS